MTQDKSKDSPKHANIAFNWERVKKTASRKIDELVCNAPKITRREEQNLLKQNTTKLVSCLNQTPKEDAECIPDFQNSGSRSKSKPSPIDTPISSPPNEKTIPEKSATPNSGNDYQVKDKDIYKDSHMHSYTSQPDPNSTYSDTLHSTSSDPLLAAAPAQGEVLTSQGDMVSGSVLPMTAEDFGPDANAIDLLGKIKNKEVLGCELAVDERQIVVKALRAAGQTQDAISSLLKVSRRTIVNDCKHLRQLAALEIQAVDTNMIAGEVYSIAKATIDKALQKGHLKTVSTVMRDMVELLQSMGLLYRAPKTSMQANLHANMNSKQGYQKYMDTIGESREDVVHVLDCMFDAIQDEKI